jgi:hypothetical protein
MTALLSFLSGCFFSLGSVAVAFSFFGPRKDDEPEIDIPDQRLRGSEGIYNYHRN